MGTTMQGPDLERWLIRVATNLSIDSLRRRKQRRYVGSWLPSPVEAAAARAEDRRETVGADEDTTQVRLERAEEVSYALLVALEALSPRARAVLLLIDVLDHSAAEVAAILGTSEGNVRILHHRARRTLQAFDLTSAMSPTVRERQREAMQKLMRCMLQQDAAGMEVLLADDVRSITDAGGQYTALGEPLRGKQAVIRFHLETARRRMPVSTTELRTINGVAALVVTTRPLRPQMAPRLVLRCEVDAAGRIREIQTVLAPGKLTAVRFDDVPPAGSFPV
jgi:RNA polymerase sigma-70 factor (ECF subfamily)